MTKYLLAATPMPGHADPVIAAAAGLAARGHDVLVHTGSLFRGAVERAGARFVPLDPAIDLDYRNLHERFPERAGLPPGPAQMLWGVRHLFADAIVPQSRGLRAILEEFPAEAIFTDMLFLGTLPLLLGTAPRPRIVHLGISSLALSGPDVAFYGAGLPPPRTARQRARNEAVARYMHGQIFAGIQAYVNEILAGCGARKLDRFVSDAVVMLPDRYVLLGLPELEYNRTVPAHLSFAGVLPPAAPQDFVPPDWWPQVEAARRAGRKIVLVTQGTIAAHDLGQLVIPAMAALGDMDALVVAITSGADPAPLRASAPANAIVTPFVPYDAMLAQTDLLVTNGGFGGVMLALRHGVPLVIAGDSEEKPEIAGRMAACGVAVDLATGNPDTALLAAAISHVFANPGFARRAGEIAAHLRGLDGIGVIETALSGPDLSAAA